jgi:hypothetical protein
MAASYFAGAVSVTVQNRGREFVVLASRASGDDWVIDVGVRAEVNTDSGCEVVAQFEQIRLAGRFRDGEMKVAVRSPQLLRGLRRGVRSQRRLDPATMRCGETFGGGRRHETLDQRAQIEKKLQLRPVRVERAMRRGSDVAGPCATDVRAADPAPGRALRLQIDDAELASRQAQWTPPAPHYERGYGAMYAVHIMQADEGFLARAVRTPNPTQGDNPDHPDLTRRATANLSTTIL